MGGANLVFNVKSGTSSTPSVLWETWYFQTPYFYSIGKYLVDLGLFLVSLRATVFLGDLTSHGVAHLFNEVLTFPFILIFLGVVIV